MKPRALAAAPPARPPGQFHRDLSVVKNRVFYDRICLSVWYLTFFDDLDGRLAHVNHGLQLDPVRSQLIGSLSGHE